MVRKTDLSGAKQAPKLGCFCPFVDLRSPDSTALGPFGIPRNAERRTVLGRRHGTRPGLSQGRRGWAYPRHDRHDLSGAGRTATPDLPRTSTTPGRVSGFICHSYGCFCGSYPKGSLGKSRQSWGLRKTSYVFNAPNAKKNTYYSYHCSSGSSSSPASQPSLQVAPSELQLDEAKARCWRPLPVCGAFCGGPTDRRGRVSVTWRRRGG